MRGGNVACRDEVVLRTNVPVAPRLLRGWVTRAVRMHLVCKRPAAHDGPHGGWLAIEGGDRRVTAEWP